MEQTKARLRKAFQYEGDDSFDESFPEVLDEEEQEMVIQSLRNQNALRNQQYTNAFLALLLLCALAYIPWLLRPGTLVTFMTSAAGVTSLAGSAYVLCFVPTLPLDPPPASGANKSFFYCDPKAVMAVVTALESRMGLGIRIRLGWLQSHLVYSTAALAALLALVGIVAQRVGELKGELWLALLPGIACGTVLVARFIMGSVDMGELEELKYHYKGA